MKADSAIPTFSAEPSTAMKFYYSKRHDTPICKEPGGNCALIRQAPPDANLSHASPCNGVFELDAFYEIDHEKLPPKSPIQLKAIRVVKLSEATNLDVTVSFPSTLALRNYFALSPEPGRDPELDERFVMSLNQAGRILRRPVPPSELEGRKHLESFWMSTRILHDSPTTMVPSVSLMTEEEVEIEQASPIVNCLLTIKRDGILGWGTRRKVKYIGRHREMSSHEQDDVDDDVQADELEQQPQKYYERKRKGDIAEEEMKKKKNKRGTKNAKNPSRVDKERKRRCDEEKKHGKATKDRWSVERYEAAEFKLLEIMKEKGAALGKPIMRHALREEARKHIGDTGLLDHLLKHMAGKVVSNGTERFRRRHNSEGAMEYWLEPADLVEVREKAGVSDTYWVPPPWWKPGDATSACPCTGEFKSEIRLLREEIAILKRDMEELRAVKDNKRGARYTQADAYTSCTVWQDKYTSMIERNNKLEKQITVISNCLQSFKEEILQLRVEKNKEMEAVKEDKEKHCIEDNVLDQGIEKANDVNISRNTDGNKNDSINGCSNITNQSISTVGSTLRNKSIIASSKRMAGCRSGFRIYKPQGTFLWPDMWSSSSSGGSGGSQREGCSQPMTAPNTTIMTTAAVEEHLMLLSGVPTPSSASSATSAHRLLLLPSPASPVLIQPSEVMPVPPPTQYHHLHLQRTGNSRNVCPSVVYHHMVAQVWEQTTASPTTALVGLGGGVEGNKIPELSGVASWDACITTDLALATPSISYL